nr:uncharacterized protein CI109_005922 [Kwoniella shandongensis]KAA5525759.1 hypothetical protein CI109_005922 [Kwoniella shandongensis]
MPNFFKSSSQGSSSKPSSKKKENSSNNEASPSKTPSWQPTGQEYPSMLVQQSSLPPLSPSSQGYAYSPNQQLPPPPPYSSWGGTVATSSGAAQTQGTVSPPGMTDEPNAYFLYSLDSAKSLKHQSENWRAVATSNAIMKNIDGKFWPMEIINFEHHFKTSLLKQEKDQKEYDKWMSKGKGKGRAPHHCKSQEDTIRDFQNEYRDYQFHQISRRAVAFAQRVIDAAGDEEERRRPGTIVIETSRDGGSAFPTYRARSVHSYVHFKHWEKDYEKFQKEARLMVDLCSQRMFDGKVRTEKEFQRVVHEAEDALPPKPLTRGLPDPYEIKGYRWLSTCVDHASLPEFEFILDRYSYPGNTSQG